MKEGIKTLLYQGSKDNAVDLIHGGQRTVGLYLAGLRDQVVLDPIEADVEHDKGGRGMRVSRDYVITCVSDASQYSTSLDTPL